MAPNFSISSLIHSQRQFFSTGATLSYSFRIAQLKKLRKIFTEHEAELVAALEKDLRKPPFEAILNEILLSIKEIDYAISHLKKWMKRKSAGTPLTLWPARSFVQPEPYGCCLIISPWNYPVMLTFSPLIGAISAGNCVMIKPSEISTHTQRVILFLINKYFNSNYIAAILGDAEETEMLLAEKFDYIFFTGSTQIGKVVMKAAAEHLTPLTLELGGKSPCIVDETANLDFAARRIAWAKTTNAGQVCIAPDYLYVHSSCKDAFIEKLKSSLISFYSADPAKSADYGRIINEKHFQRLIALMTRGNILFGGQIDATERYISPTLIDDVTWSDPIMEEEIFGPLLPILTFDHLDELITLLKTKPKPLALYFFSKNDARQQQVLSQLSFGGGCINDCLLQVANFHLPFGGVGQSGMGHYHGVYSFETFSHQKSIYKKLFPFDLKIEYPPFSSKKLAWLRKLLN